MLRPQDTTTRETKLLDGLWDFAIDVDGAGRSEEWWRRPLADARAVPVPCSYKGNKKGIFTRDRRPKLAAHHLRRRRLGAERPA